MAKEGEIYVRADGKKVRRVRKSTSSTGSGSKSLSGFLSEGDKSGATKKKGSRSVAGEGEIYVRPDGKKVRRVRKSSSSSVGGSAASVGAGIEPKKKSLGGFLEKADTSKIKVGGSASVAGDQIAVGKESSLTGEVYVRADGKKVRRVKKKSAALADGSNVEIIVRPDGTKVRRIRKVKPTDDDADSKPGLSGFLEKGTNGGQLKKPFSGSHSVAGDQNIQGEIYVRSDGKKVRRVKKVKPISAVGGATIAADNTPDKKEVKPEAEIYTRPDGTKVRRISRSASKSKDEGEKKKTLAGFLGKAEPTKPKIGGSASVAGDQIAVGKESSLTGEVYVRADGKKVRRVRKVAPSSAAAGDTVEIITRPDGTKVRRIRRAKTKPKSQTEGGLSGFLDSQPKSKPKGGAATVGGDIVSKNEVAPLKPLTAELAKKVPEPKKEEPKKEEEKKDPDSKRKTLEGFLSRMDSKPKKLGESNSVAGDQIAVDKKASLTGEVYVRADGKKVRRVKKSSSSVQPGDKVEIITRPDGTKVRRIKRAKKTAADVSDSASVGASDSASVGAASVGRRSLGGFFRSKGPQKKGRANSVAGDMVHRQAEEAAKELGEIYVRPDGKKVRRIRKSTASVSGKLLSSGVTENGDKYEIYLREDGKKVRKIKRSASNAQKGAATVAPSTNKVPQKGVAATVAGDDLTNKASLKPISTPAPAAPGAKYSKLSSAEEETATQYRKMIKMGMPGGAVQQKMLIDGVAQNIVDSVIAGEVPAPPGAASTSSPPSEATPAVKYSKLSTVDEETATKYRKMLKMGMPDGAVQQKMLTDGVEQSIVDSVLAREAPAPVAGAASTTSPPPEATPAVKYSKLSTVDEETATKYRKMLKMGMPDGAVQQKMLTDGVEQSIVDSVLAREAPAPAGAKVGVIPKDMVLVPKDQANIPNGMVMVPKEQAERTVPEGMIVAKKDQIIPEGFVLVPEDKVKGDVGLDLVLVNKNQVKDSTIVLKKNKEEDEKNLEKDVKEDDEIIEAKNTKVITIDDLPERVEKLRREGKTFLLQALPNDERLQNDFLKKNMLPKAPPAPAPAAPAKKAAPAATSESIAEILAQMSEMGNAFDAEKMGELLTKLQESEKKRVKLEKQLAGAGIAIAEDIDYDVCIKKIQEIGKRMGEIGSSDVVHPDKDEQNRLREEYFKLEQDMEKYSNALLLTDEYQEEQKRKEREWEEANSKDNIEALKKLRRHMPVEVRNMSEAQLTNEPSPNGKYLPASIAKKFKRTNVLQIIRRDPDDLARMHPSTLENLRVTGLTLTERRAVYEHVRKIGPVWESGKAEKMTERKWIWFKMMKSNFKESLASYQRHVKQYGPPGNHPYATRANPNQGCPLLGKQCPLKADKLIDYDKANYGWTDKAVYEVSDVKKADADDPGAKAKAEALELMKEKKANERADALKKHYKGKLLNVSKANGSCESMDEIMDKMEFGMEKWIEDIISMGSDKSKLTDDVKKKELSAFNDVMNDCKLSILDFCGRSGMQLSGKKSGDEKPDPRSVIECSLAEEVKEMFEVFSKFVQDRLKKTGIMDTKIKSTVTLLTELLDELHGRNTKTISKLGAKRLVRSRPLKTEAAITKEVKNKIAAKAPPPAAAAGPGPGGMPGGGRGGGRGGLLDAINGRGGRGGGRGGGGRGGLLDAIQGRGGRGGRGGGGRGGLLDAIQGRGRGGRGPPGGGRGDLMAAIAGRGAGRGRGGGDAGGRGGLLAAIAARGGGG